MAIYHLHAQALSRSSGASAVAAAAYRSGESLADERTGERHDYSRRGGVEGTEILAPEGAPAWALDRETLWNAVEAAERRKNSQVAREVRVAIPAELGDRARRDVVREFVREQFADRGMVADLAFHDFAGENPHAHILLTMRRIDGGGFSKRKEREWNSRAALQGWRKAWEMAANRALEREGREERIDHRTLAAQREEALERGDAERAAELDREPEIHMGRAASHMAVKGIATERGARFIERDERNRGRRQVRERGRLLEQLRQQLEQIRTWAERLGDLDRRMRRVAEQMRIPWRGVSRGRTAKPRQGRATAALERARERERWRGPSR